jgi:hypothetical protein
MVPTAEVCETFAGWRIEKDFESNIVCNFYGPEEREERDGKMKTEVNIPELQDLLARVDQALEMVETMITNAELIFADLESKK